MVARRRRTYRTTRRRKSYRRYRPRTYRKTYYKKYKKYGSSKYKSRFRKYRRQFKKSYSVFYAVYKNARTFLKTELNDFYHDAAKYDSLKGATDIYYALRQYYYFFLANATADIFWQKFLCFMSYGQSSSYISPATLMLSGFLRRFKKKYGYKANFHKMSLVDRMLFSAYYLSFDPYYKNVAPYSSVVKVSLIGTPTPAQNGLLNTIFDKVIQRSFPKDQLPEISKFKENMAKELSAAKNAFDPRIYRSVNSGSNFFDPTVDPNRPFFGN